MRLLIVTRIFPSSAQPEHAPYNRLQFGELSKLCQVRLLALVPWLPGRSLLRRSAQDLVPRAETVDGLPVEHPRVLYAPGFGRPLSGLAYTASLWPRVRRERGRVDLVLGSFAYPDGWAAVALGRLLGVPAAIKLHGSDVHVYGQDPLLRPLVRSALRRAAAVVAPSQELVDTAVALGADPRTSCAVPNGVDQRAFRARERDACRVALGHSKDQGRWVLFVGRVERQKGVLDLMQAFLTVGRTVPDARLVLLGDGVDRPRCEAFARANDLRVLFAGARRPDDVPLWMGASDLVTLPSWAEGTPNVILEALASGRRVVATTVGGIPAVVDDPLLGELVAPRSPEQLGRALVRALETRSEPAAVRTLAATIGWRESAGILFRLLSAAATGAPLQPSEGRHERAQPIGRPPEPPEPPEAYATAVARRATKTQGERRVQAR